MVEGWKRFLIVEENETCYVGCKGDWVQGRLVPIGLERHETWLHTKMQFTLHRLAFRPKSAEGAQPNQNIGCITIT